MRLRSYSYEGTINFNNVMRLADKMGFLRLLSKKNVYILVLYVCFMALK